MFNQPANPSLTNCSKSHRYGEPYKQIFDQLSNCLNGRRTSKNTFLIASVDRMQMTANLVGFDRMNAIFRQTNPFPLQLSLFVDTSSRHFQTEYKASRSTSDVITIFTQSPEAWSVKCETNYFFYFLLLILWINASVFLSNRGSSEILLLRSSKKCIQCRSHVCGLTIQ